MIYNFVFEKNTLPLVDSFATITTMNNNASPNQTTATNRTSMTDKIAGVLDNSPTTSITKEADSYPPLVKSDSINEKKSNDLSLSKPFYSSKDSMVLNKIHLNSMSDSNTTKELKIFYEFGLIDNLETVHNIGYYVEELKPMTAMNESMLDNQIRELLTDNRVKFGKGTGFYVAADTDIIGWNAYDQVFNTLGNITKYLGIIYFTTNEIPDGILSSFNNKVGIYEYDLYSNGTAIRNIWLWPVISY
ncbi:MAG TPA: hypothetical protein VFT71_07795 [Candidatus Nitrosocosmicus sp.]|nr:hypothetical protein [Candidatus Nitrosocosmicus sp.]